jgi:hypothetical protein
MKPERQNQLAANFWAMQGENGKQKWEEEKATIIRTRRRDKLEMLRHTKKSSRNRRTKGEMGLEIKKKKMEHEKKHGYLEVKNGEQKCRTKLI